jgi:hypothetical protein
MTSRFIFLVLWALGFVGDVASFVPPKLATVVRRHLVQKNTKTVGGSSSTTARFAIFNFGPASTRDTVLYTAERPGNPPDKASVADEQQVEAWLAFMKERGVSNVIALLDDNELDSYASIAPDGGLVRIYENAGMTCLVQSMRDPNASRNVFQFIRQVEADNGKVVAHCTGGIGRAGRVAAGWLVDR